MNFRREEVANFFLGAGSISVILGALGADVMIQFFMSENQYTALKYGINTNVHNIAIASVCVSIASNVLAIIAIFTNYCVKKRKLDVTFNVLNFILLICLIICMGVAIEWTKYGGSVVPQYYNYYNDSDSFKQYVDNYSDSSLATLAEALGMTYPEFQAKHPDFYVSYISPDYTPVSIGSCMVDLTNSTLNSTNPCTYSVDITTCVGGWNSRLFSQYLCEVYNNTIEEASDIAGMSTVERDKYYAVKAREDETIYSFAGLHYYDIIFIIYLVPAIVVIIVAYVCVLSLENCCAARKSKSGKSKPESDSENLFITDLDEKEDKKDNKKREKEEKKREAEEKKREEAERKKREKEEKKREAEEKKREAEEKKREEAEKKRQEKEAKKNKKKESSSSSSSSDDNNGAAPPPPPPPPPAMPKYKEDPQQQESETTETQTESDEGDDDDDDDDDGIEEEGGEEEEGDDDESSSSSSSSD
ncbi:hypothetical protein GPJ56_004570 [Histomonas meleagridis]|uniref:uncharacterized protein n=1 Tax=Histomonas meleagridis TaxID=135588 RepID=UPI003559E7B4|nr:hypothetical protein GPJ56_004570 [Histomonas meleagridis]KAH0800140.1 hypothetical protein GO595_007252 [Histomonas meleagridis]